MVTAIVRVLKVPQADTTGASPRNDIANALKREGIEGFLEHFIHLTQDDIEKLCHDHGTTTTGPLVTKLMLRDQLALRALLAFFHWNSHKKGSVMLITSKTADEFKEYKAKFYDPTEPIIPWTRMMGKSDTLAQWNRNVKPDARGYPFFRDITTWIEFKENVVVTCDSQNMTHLIDPNYKVVDPDLDAAQRKYMYKVMKDRFLHHEAKRIVKKHVVDKDTRLIWQEVCAHYDDSVTTSMAADKVLNYLTGVKLHEANWTKGQGEFLTHYVTNVRKFNEMAPDSAINPDQSVRMLQNCISGTPNLANVLSNQRQTLKASGKPIKIELDEFVALLSEPAQVYDNANNRTRSSLRRRANVHEFEEGALEYEANIHSQEDDDSYPDFDEILEVNQTMQRDQKTGRYTKGKTGSYGTQKRQANFTQGGRTRAYMDRETWMSLSDNDKKAWDSLSDPARLAITTFHFKKGKEVAQRDATQSNKHEVNESHMVFDDDSDDNDQIEASVHMAEPQTPQPKADIQSTKAMYEQEGVSWDTIVQAGKDNNRLEATMCAFDEESDDDEPVTHLEINSHILKGSDEEEEELLDLEDEVDEPSHNQESEDDEDLEEEEKEELLDIGDDDDLEQEETQNTAATNETVHSNTSSTTQVQPTTYANALTVVPAQQQPSRKQVAIKEPEVEDDEDLLLSEDEGELDAAKSELKPDSEEEVFTSDDWPDDPTLCKYMTIDGKKQMVMSKDGFKTYKLAKEVISQSDDFEHEDLLDLEGEEETLLDPGNSNAGKTDNVPKAKTIKSGDEFAQEGMLRFDDSNTGQVVAPVSLQTPTNANKVMTRKQCKEANIEVPSLFPNPVTRDDTTILQTASASPPKNPKNNPRSVPSSPMQQYQKHIGQYLKEQKAISTADKQNPNMSGQFKDVPKPMKSMDKIQKGKDGKYKLKSEAEIKEESSDEEKEDLLDIDDEASLHTVTSEKESEELSAFHASALQSATIQGEIIKTPIDPGFTPVRTKKKRKPKSLGKMACELGNTALSAVGFGSPLPESSSSEDDSKASDSNNRFAVLGDNEEANDDVTGDNVNVEEKTSSPTLALEDNQSTQSDQDASDGASSLLLLSQDSQPATVDETKQQDFQEAGSE